MKTLACLLILCFLPMHLCAEEVPPAVESIPDPAFEKLGHFWLLTRDEKSRVFFARYQLKDKAVAVFTLNTKVDTLKEGLARLEPLLPADSPIVALAQLDGWFIYATKVISKDAETAPSIYRIGYAIKRGGTDVIYWGSW